MMGNVEIHHFIMNAIWISHKNMFMSIGCRGRKLSRRMLRRYDREFGFKGYEPIRVRSRCTKYNVGKSIGKEQSLEGASFVVGHIFVFFTFPLSVQNNNLSRYKNIECIG